MSSSANSKISLRDLLARARSKQPGLIALTRQLVQVESPSDNKSAVDACLSIAAAHGKLLGGRVKIHRNRNFGNALEIRFGPRASLGSSAASAAKPILLLGHLDTVWPLGTLKKMPCRVSPGHGSSLRLLGPGTLDMKAGVAIAFTAVELLTEARLLRREIILLLNGDEEIGSTASRPITEKIAKTCSAVYVLEPAQGLAYKTARKGIGDWRIDVKGIAAHAGVDFEKGANAIRELARVIEKVSSWTDLKRGLTVSVGVIGGGTKTNVIPAHAWAQVDARIARSGDGLRIERKFAALKPTNPRCTLIVTGGINRPPMERRPGTVRLFRQAQLLARGLGFALDEAATGGGSDGNFTAALGIPTLDGMGAVGEGAHAAHESVLIEHLAPRTALLAAMLSVNARGRDLHTRAPRPDKLACVIQSEIFSAMNRFVPVLFLAACASAAFAQTPAAKPATPAKPATAAKPASSTANPGTTKPATAAAAATAPEPQPWIKLPPGVPRVVHGLVKMPFALRYEDVKVGTGALGESGKIWHLKYTGWRAADGVKFDSWDDHKQPAMGPDGKPKMGPDGKPVMGDPVPIAIPQGMGRVIPGFDYGLEGMKIGGKRRIFIPWQMAYATHAIPDRPDHPGIPAKSDLIFDVELVDVTDMPAPHPPMMPGNRPMPQMPPHPGAPPSATPAPKPAPPTAPAQSTPAPTTPSQTAPPSPPSGVQAQPQPK